jgi:predicted PhzF superfamily epimerase YddE/YHI9
MNKEKEKIMKLPFYQVDAFASKVFSGNPAAVCLLDEWPADETMQAIAAENNLSETAFLVRNATGYDLRWFTPSVEVALCGHATLASAFVLFNCCGWTEDAVAFQTRMSGRLAVTRRGDLYEMDFPARPVHRIDPPPGLLTALGVAGGEVYGSDEDLMVVLESEHSVRKLSPDMAKLGQIECRGVIVTAVGDRSDFVSRFFGPRVGVPEDPVTGSAHCVLIPYWAGRLNKKDLFALQVSKRSGEVYGRDCKDRVRISGRAVLYSEGAFYI